MRRRIVIFLFLALLIGFSAPSPAAQHEPAARADGIPFKQTEEITAGTYIRVGATLLFVLAVAVVAILVLKKVMLERQLIKLPAARIRLLEARRISSRTSLFLVAVDDTEYLVTQAGNGNSVIRHASSPGPQGEGGAA